MHHQKERIKQINTRLSSPLSENLDSRVSSGTDVTENSIREFGFCAGSSNASLCKKLDKILGGMAKVVTDGSLRSSAQNHKANAKEWRLFMSPRVSNTLSSVAAQQSVSMDDEEKLHKKEFDTIFKEVEQLGTSQMSWKKRKGIEMQKMIALGAKPEKGHRMPITMGRNIKRKRERLEEQKLQEDVALGLVSAKREKKSIDKPNTSSRGLKASEGVFKGGVLYVKPLTTKREENFQPSKGKGRSARKGKKGKKKGKKRRR